MEHKELSTTLPLRDGRMARIRLLAANDAKILGNFFCGLSEETRSTYGPHPFDRETAARLCDAVGDGRTARFLAVLADGTPEAEIIAYMILSRDIWEDDRRRYGDTVPWETTACLAPVVADAHQGQGLGSAMGQHLLASARAMGLSHVILMGGVLEKNRRAQHVYEKLGFEHVGSFWTGSGNRRRLNHDMIVRL
ncbi:MAG: GNAT family N-acetyltransferase [Anaerolineae bacterium]